MCSAPGFLAGVTAMVWAVSVRSRANRVILKCAVILWSTVLVILFVS